ncbi:MAG: FAD:protein FMN transferase, partial [Actinobacteria bacterium]
MSPAVAAPGAPPSERVAADRWSALGTEACLLCTQPRALPSARRAVDEELRAIDLACSRFRDDSELTRVNRCAGREVTIGPLLLEAVEAALRAARITDGDVDP